MFGLKKVHLLGLGALVTAIALFFAFSGDSGKRKKDRSAQGKKKRRKNADASGTTLASGSLCAAIQCTSEQLQRVRPILTEHKQATREDTRALRQARVELARAYGDAQFSDDDLDATYSTIAQHQSQLVQHARATLSRVHAELDEPQRAALAKLVAAEGTVALFDRPQGTADHKIAKGKGKSKGKSKGKRKGKRVGSRLGSEEATRMQNAWSGKSSRARGIGPFSGRAEPQEQDDPAAQPVEDADEADSTAGQ